MINWPGWFSGDLLISKKDWVIELMALKQKLGNRINGVEQRLSGIEQRLDDVVLDVSDIKKGQKEIIKKFDEKVDQVEFVKLEKRVDVLEKVAVKQKKN